MPACWHMKFHDPDGRSKLRQCRIATIQSGQSPLDRKELERELAAGVSCPPMQADYSVACCQLRGSGELIEERILESYADRQ